MLRLRLYDILCRLPPTAYEGAYKSLFRELVAEFTLTGKGAICVIAVNILYIAVGDYCTLLYIRAGDCCECTAF